jgi:hypothetical protein
MNKEQQELLDDAYFKRYRLEAWGLCDRSWLLELDGINLTTGEKGKVHRQLTQEEFIDRCKTNPEFSETWGLKIEERELSCEMRYNIWFNNNYETGMEKYFDPNKLPDFDNKYYEPTPTKLITITYKGTKIESYE